MSTAEVKHRQASVAELHAAQETVQSFVTAFKSFSLYPEDHILCRANLEHFQARLDTFLQEYGELSLAVRKNTFVYEDEVVFDAQPEENNPAYLLTRDGIIRLSFSPGMDPAETADLLRILKRHRSAGDDSGGDIAASLWLAEFLHLEYEEVDIFALETFEFDLGSLKVSPEDAASMAPETEAGDEAGANGETGTDPSFLTQEKTAANLLQTDKSLKIFDITPQEQEVLQSYIREEENKNYTNDVIDVLLIILVSQKNKLHFSQVLDFLASVFFDSMDNGLFHLSHKLCGNVLSMQDQLRKLRPWTMELIDRFLADLSAPESWAEVSWIGAPGLPAILSHGRRDSLWQTLRLLNPAILLTFGPLMDKIDAGHIDVRNELYEFIEDKARQSPETFNELLAMSGETINQMLFPMIERFAPGDAAKICLQMTRHESAQVRRTGLRGYVTYAASPEPEALYPLLGDEDGEIVDRLMQFLLSAVEPGKAEELLLRFIRQAVDNGKDHPNMFEYYKAVSRCGAANTVKELEKILMECPLTEMFSNTGMVHKKGAALALNILGTEEAMQALAKAGNSLRPDIRTAYQFARDKMS